MKEILLNFLMYDTLKSYRLMLKIDLLEIIDD